MPTPVHLKALVGFYKLSDVDVVKNGITVQTNMTGNPKFPNSPVDLAVLWVSVGRSLESAEPVMNVGSSSEW